MPRKTDGITPENLAKFVAAINNLPKVEPEIIPTEIALGQNKAEIEAALARGQSVETVLKHWNEFGRKIKIGTFKGHLKMANIQLTISTPMKPRKNGAATDTAARKPTDKPTPPVKQAAVERAASNEPNAPTEDIGTGPEPTSEETVDQIEDAAIAGLRSAIDIEDEQYEELIARREAERDAGGRDGDRG